LRHSSHQIRTRRNRLGIPPFKPKRAAKVWLLEEIELLGRFSNTEEARRVGCPRHVVRMRRHILKIPLVGRRPWTPKEERLPAKLSDETLARRLNRTVVT